MVIHAKSEGAHHAPPACRKTICETDSPDARKVALAPEAKGGKHTFFDIQRTITVLPLYITLMRFLIKLNSLQIQKDRQPNTDGLLAGVEGFEPSARGFGDRCSTN